MSKLSWKGEAGFVGPVSVEPVSVEEGLATVRSNVASDIVSDIAINTGLIGNSANRLIAEAENRTKAEILNAGCTRNLILKNGWCEQIILDEKLQEAFRNIRRGYPEAPMEEQCSGQEFRENADLIISALAGYTMTGLDPKKVVVMMPWRAGLAFSRGYMEHGAERFYHVSSRRDEATLETIVDYEDGHVEAGDTVIMADPMLATGNTAVDAIRRLIGGGIKPDHIIINAVVAAPVGVRNVKKEADIRVITGALDERLNHRGYIEQGLGDFGDKYYGNYRRRQIDDLAAALKMGDNPRQKLVERFQAHTD